MSSKLCGICTSPVLLPTEKIRNNKQNVNIKQLGKSKCMKFVSDILGELSLLQILKAQVNDTCWAIVQVSIQSI